MEGPGHDEDGDPLRHLENVFNLQRKRLDTGRPQVIRLGTNQLYFHLNAALHTGRIIWRRPVDEHITGTCLGVVRLRTFLPHAVSEMNCATVVEGLAVVRSTLAAWVRNGAKNDRSFLMRRIHPIRRKREEA